MGGQVEVFANSNAVETGIQQFLSVESSSWRHKCIEHVGVGRRQHLHDADGKLAQHISISK
ncbi:YfcC family protein [Sesbania bispinosa]|nr:YfcC family protein [Sesbania bispinosa]